jgi:tetratricopeptide (TPR) repeat protein
MLTNFSKYFLLLTGIFCSVLVQAQIKAEVDPNDPRKSENEIKIEHKFVTAKYLSMIGKSDEAIKMLDSIRRVSKPSAAIHYELAKLYIGKKNYNLAEENINTGIKIDPKNKGIYSLAIEYYKLTGNEQQCISAWNQLIRVEPNNVKNYDDLATYLYAKKKYKDVIEVLNQKELAIGSSEKTTIFKAEAYDLDGNVGLAIKELEKLVLKNPNNLDHLKLIVSVLQSNEKQKEAVPYLQKILAIDPDDSDAKLALLVVQNKSISSDDDFISMMTPLITNPQVDIDTKIKELMPLVLKHAQTGDSLLGKSLIIACDKLVATHPEESKAHAAYGDVLMNSQKIDAAIIQYEKAIMLFKSNFMIWEQLMNGLDAKRNLDRLSEISEQCIEFFPNKALPYYYVAKSAALRNNIKKANEFIGEANLIAAGNTYINTLTTALQGYIEFKSNNSLKAIDLLKLSIEMSQNKYGQAYHWLGDVYTSMNQSQKAKEMYDLAIKSGFRINS